MAEPVVAAGSGAAEAPNPPLPGRRPSTDPQILQALQYDVTVRESAAAAAADKKASGSNQVQRTWSFSNSNGRSSQLKQLIAKEEQTRAHAFQTALLEQAFYTYAVLVQAIVGNLSRISRTHRRRWPLLVDYLRCLEQHRMLCLALLPPVEDLGQPAHLQEFERPPAPAPAPGHESPVPGKKQGSGKEKTPGSIGHWLAATEGKEPVPTTSPTGWSEPSAPQIEAPSPPRHRPTATSPLLEQASADELVLQQAAAAADSRAARFSPPASPAPKPRSPEPAPAAAPPRSPVPAPAAAVPPGPEYPSTPGPLASSDPAASSSAEPDAAPPAAPQTPAVPRVPQLPPDFTLQNDPPDATAHFIQTTPLDVFKVRGANYLDDKVKVTASQSALELLGADLVRTQEAAIEHACIGNAAARLAQIRKDHPGRDILLLNWQLPGRPGGISLMLWLGLAEEAKSNASFFPLWQKWYAGESDDFRNQRLKFIPHAHQASWMLKRAVGNRPAILGKAMKMRYHRGDGYLEIDVDIASSSTAVNLWGLVQGVAKGLVMDLGFVLEAQEREWLPELLLAAVRVHKVDLGPSLPELVEPEEH